jgi:uncharacterized membrane protein HdeD (DUF308 family)
MTMPTEPRLRQELSVVALGCGISSALVVLYVLCWLAVFIVPGLAHGWLALFSNEPPGSITSLIAGIVWSIILGWVAAWVLGSVYNTVLERRRR